MRTLIAFLLLCSPVAALDYNVGEVRDSADTYHVPPLPTGARVLVVVGQTPEVEAECRAWAAERGWAFFVREPGDGATAKHPHGWQPGIYENEVREGGKLHALKAPSSPSNATVTMTYSQPDPTTIVYGTPVVTCHEAALPTYQPLPVYRYGDRVIASDPAFSTAPGPEYQVSQGQWIDSGTSSSTWRASAPAAPPRAVAARPTAAPRMRAAGPAQSFGGFSSSAAGCAGGT